MTRVFVWAGDKDKLRRRCPVTIRDLAIVYRCGACKTGIATYTTAKGHVYSKTGRCTVCGRKVEIERS